MRGPSRITALLVTCIQIPRWLVVLCPEIVTSAHTMVARGQGHLPGRRPGALPRQLLVHHAFW